MQFVYIDESGTGDEPISVMVGVIADAYRMRPTKQHWNELLLILGKIINREIKEFHTREFYAGNGPWRALSGEQRSAIIDAIISWLVERRHSIVYTSVEKVHFYADFHNEQYYPNIQTLWRFMALHLTLAIQKRFQGAPRGKNRKVNHPGHCVMIFDNENREEKRYTDLVLSAPDWTDQYYDKLEKQEKFSQIVDVPHFVDSKDVGLIQLSDLLCYLLRRNIELSSKLAEPEYEDEIRKVAAWTNKIIDQSIPKSNIFPSKGRCDCADLFYRYAPNAIKN